MPRPMAELLDALIMKCTALATKVGPSQAGRAPLEELNQVLGQMISIVIGEPRDPTERTVGYALLMFSFGDEGWGSYVSNSDRQDMIKALREMADKLERRRDQN